MGKHKESELVKMIKDALTKKSVTDLDEKQLNLLRLCRKLIAIEYRNEFGSDLYEMPNNSYNGQVNE